MSRACPGPRTRTSEDSGKLTRRRDVDEAIQSLSAAHLRCRDYGHAWTPYDAYRIPGGFNRRMRCRDCGTLREQLLDRSGDVLKGHYSYAEGYLIAGIGRLVGADRGRLRLASVLAGDLRDGPPDA